MMGMFNMAKGMMKPHAKSSAKKLSEEYEQESDFDLLEKVDKYADQIAIIASVLDKNYAGGDFCEGLTVGYEGRQVATDMAMTLVKGMFT